MIDLFRARERLAEYRDKVQPYPPYPDEEVPKPMPQVIEHIVRHSNMGKKEFDLLQQLKLKMDSLDNKLTEHLKPREKPTTYKGLKL